MDDNRPKKVYQISRRQLIRGALVAVGLAIVNPRDLLDAFQNTKKAGDKASTVPDAGDSIQPVVTTPVNLTKPTTIPPVSSAASSDLAPIGYSLTISGLIDKPMTLNYDSLLQFPSVTSTVTLTCPGVFEETSEWTGVPLISILTAAGIKPEATQINVSGSSGYAAPFSVQEQAVTSGAIFLAFKYNGLGLPADRGYPLRLVVPGAEGTAWVKGVANITVL
jgi:DMSO/TMAO reductase YedYZ molybdopterin-dependent catalytic subunit